MAVHIGVEMERQVYPFWQACKPCIWEVSSRSSCCGEPLLHHRVEDALESERASKSRQLCRASVLSGRQANLDEAEKVFVDWAPPDGSGNCRKFMMASRDGS
jgi:hypothetical protein